MPNPDAYELTRAKPNTPTGGKDGGYYWYNPTRQRAYNQVFKSPLEAVEYARNHGLRAYIPVKMITLFAENKPQADS